MLILKWVARGKIMRYESAKNLKDSDFKRSYGVYFDTFKDMVKVVKVERMLKKKQEEKIN